MPSLPEQGFLELPPLRLEYRMVGPRPDAAPTLVLLHQGLGSAGLWGDFPERLAAASGFGVFAYSREGYGHSNPAPLPRALDFMHREAREVLPRVLAAIERWHADPSATVHGWSDVWLTNDVSRWDLSEDLAYIRVPILIIQGEQDTFGTARQIEI